MENNEDNQNETEQSQQDVMDSFQFPLVTNGLLTNQIMGTNPQLLPNGMPIQFPYPYPSQYQIPRQQLPPPQFMQQELRLQLFWADQLQEVLAIKDFKNHSLPLARIKKIMKADEEVKMIAAETPVIFSKACEMFILELTHRAYFQAELNKRKTLLKSDLSLAVANHQMFDFLVDIVPMEEAAHGGAAAAATIPGVEELNQSIPCFYDPSNFSSLMVDMRHPEMLPHGSSSTQQHQYGNASEDGGTPPPSSPP
ncbi:nuclear transcription factor Y subunit C-2-like [Phalaenopsis equestris]|uniref:nuclear transcription factor Y subunit C-2-like n=1 Tax=Phalaenopsis equestris TaxID=78828 RepID=UPI0009E5E98D|nr:nuclear transcription factor Y subunit C-2-like [Phalaenopsis equestris]